MAKHLLRKRKLETHKDSRPDDGMESYNFLTNEVNISRPVAVEVIILVVLIAESVDVVGKSVYPYVNNVLFIEVYRDAP